MNLLPRHETRTISMAAIWRAIKDNYGIEGRGSGCHDSIHFTGGSGLWDVGHPCQFRPGDASISLRSSIRSFGISSINPVSRSPVDSYALENDPYPPSRPPPSSRLELTNFLHPSRGPISRLDLADRESFLVYSASLLAPCVFCFSKHVDALCPWKLLKSKNPLL